MAMLAGTVRTAGSTVTTISSGHLLLQRRQLFRTSMSHLEARKCMDLNTSNLKCDLSHPGRLGPLQINLAKADLDLQRTRRLPHRTTTLGVCGKEMILPVLKGHHRRNINVGVETLIRSPGTILSRPKQVRTGERTGGRQHPVIGILNDNQTSRAEAGHVDLEITIIEMSHANQEAADGDPGCIFSFESDDIVGPPNLLSLIFH